MGACKQKVIVVVGATGSGKSDLAIRLAREFNGEIICADSRTVYRGMNIGTAKARDTIPTLPATGKFCPRATHGRASRETKRGRGGEVDVGASQTASPPPSPPLHAVERGRVRHHLLDIRDPDETYSVAEFQRDTMRHIRAIARRGKVPIVVGGSMLYVRSLLDPLALPPVPPNPELRQRLERKTTTQLFRMLQRLDPDAASWIERQNSRRLIRAIEVVRATKQPFAASRGRGELAADFLILGVRCTRADLHQRIARRVRVMFRRGFLAEVAQLIAQYSADCEALRGAGYREAVAWLMLPPTARLPQCDLIARITSAHWRYARKQCAWLQALPRVRWVRSASEAARHLRPYFA